MTEFFRHLLGLCGEGHPNIIHLMTWFSTLGFGGWTFKSIVKKIKNKII